MDILASDKPELTVSYTHEEAIEWLRSIVRMIEGNVRSAVVLKRAYAIVDNIMAKDIAPHFKCKRGCSHCCRVPVSATWHEARLIADFTGVEMDATATNRTLTQEEVGDAPCPMLDVESGECTVYAVRPMACRVFGSFDEPELFCEKDASLSHFIFCLMPVEEERNFINVLYLETMTRLAQRDGHAIMKDMREYFY